ncbi:alpha-galactosidase [Sinomicrobium soli]|uniref:alpha-galactosidase n=1 Tax=Sinomicrobium sp. N-1-3-6 TaxID=2219864 RepID=UPI000DCEF52B|nr:alpha-galactosidase [Sinomicrobium sp. N-1-3-6]RAV28017.1 alpha-galactosidase [Sinomicrobium sp. N-1-3-6]
MFKTLSILLKGRIASFAMFFVFFQVSAQEIITVETAENALVFEVNESKELNTVYFGEKLKQADEYRQISSQYKQGTDYTGIYASAYTPAGSKNLLEPAIEVTHADGNMSLSLEYVSSEAQEISPGVVQTEILLRDNVYPLEVRLFFKSYSKENVVETWSVIENRESGDVRLHKFASANLYVRGNNDFWLTHYSGDWAMEMKPETSKLSHGIKVHDSKLGTRANLFQPSVFTVSLGGPASEEHGSVLMGGLEWSGNFRNEFEVDPLNNLRIISGINNYASEYTLKKGEAFTTPKFWFTLSDKGKGDASRNIHRWARNHKVLDGKGSRLTLLNNWEATYFDFDEKKLKKLIGDTRKLGVDLFLLDDGWFGNTYPRNNDDAGLGDWDINRKKLPNGIGTLVETARKNQVKFGIWIEPEMVNPDSELYHKHPEWVIKQPEREEHYFRNQLVLDLSNPEVQDFVYGVVDKLFTENPDLAYIKWDCNAVIYNAYSDYLGANQSELYIRYVQGLYDVLERIRKKYPEVPMMLCSGGGGRVDYAALEYFTEFWPSDNTDPLERVYMQWEYSVFYPSLTMAAHVTDWGDQSIKFKTDVAMMGKLGFDVVIDELEDSELEFCRQAIANYNELEDVIWQGDLYRLRSPWENNTASLMYVGEHQDEAVVFNYRVNYRYEQGSHIPVKLKGLRPDARYTVEEINIYPGEQAVFESRNYTGDYLMKVGINPNVKKDNPSVVLRLKTVPK